MSDITIYQSLHRKTSSTSSSSSTSSNSPLNPQPSQQQQDKILSTFANSERNTVNATSASRPLSFANTPSRELRIHLDNVPSSHVGHSRVGTIRKGLESLTNRTIQIRILRTAWLLGLLVGEYGSFWIFVHKCSWPENSSWDDSKESMKERYRVAIIADPQLTDWYSYGQSGILLTLVETYTDIYMRRAFNRLHSSLRPDAVLFLGDLNDGGRDSNDKIFEKNRERFFERVFKTKQTAWNQQPLLVDPEVPIGDNHNGTPYTPSTHYRQVQNIPLDADVREKMRQNGKSVRLYVAGNHDVGFGDTLIRPSMTRYKGVFGATNYEVTVGNHSFVVLDSLSISSNIKDIRQESDQFLNKITQEPSTLPRILFTHVPLFRHGTTQCGPERETKKMILSGNGTQYQNLVNRTLTQQILTGIQPDMIFSGDDHDWCEVAHPIPNNSSHNNVASSFAPEVTLPTFSFAQGIWQPGFVVMSLYNPNLQKSKNVYPLVPVSSGLPVTLNDTTYLNSVAGPTDDTTFAYAECLLPIQLFIYLGYGLFFICTLLIIGGSQLWRMAQSQKQPSEMGTAQYLDMTTLPESHRPAHSSTANALPLSMSTPTNSWYNENNDGNDNSTERKGFWRPLYSIAFWKACGWDIWNIAKYAIPFYIFLFVISFF